MKLEEKVIQYLEKNYSFEECLLLLRLYDDYKNYSKEQVAFNENITLLKLSS